MTRGLGAAALAVVLLAACSDDAPASRSPAARRAGAAAVFVAQDAADDDVVERARAVVERRLAVPQWEGTTVERHGRELRVVFPMRLAGAAAEVRPVVEAPGTLELCLVAEDQARLQEIVHAGGELPPGVRAVPAAHDAGSVDWPSWVVEAPDGFSHRRFEVFTEADLAGARAEASGPSDVGHRVTFTIVDDGKPAFRAFTERHVGRALAIIVDGRVVSAPVLRSVLPGAGVIYGGGAGFTREEAERLAAALRAGRLPCGLKFVRVEPAPR